MATASEVLAKLAALAGENEAAVGSNNTTVNKYYKAAGQAYCGYSVMYAFAMAGSKLLDGSGAWNVGNLARFCEARGWRVSAPRAGDIFIMRSGGYENGHTGFVYEVLGNGYFITLEGNYGAVKATAAEARNGTGRSFEGIGYRRAAVGGNFKFYRPTYDDADKEHAPVPEDPNRVGPALDVTLALCRAGHSGPMVKTIQRICYSYGYKGADGRPITATGTFDANTVYAVKRMQAKLGVEADGEVGENTWNAMLKKLA